MSNLIEFVKKHPSVDEGLIEASYISCQGKREEDLFKIFEHTENCPWCKSYMGSQREMEERCKPSQKDVDKSLREVKELGQILAKLRLAAA